MRTGGEERAPRQKILKAPLSAQLTKTSSDALNEVDAQLKSESSSAPGETGGQSQGCEASVARPLGSEAATSASAADAAPGEGSLATGARDEGQAKAVIAQFAEPSVEAEKNSLAEKTGRDHEVGDASAAVASFDGAVDPLREAMAALDDRDYATAQRLFAAIGRKDVAEAIKDALAALDRKDYATAQGLFEALGKKGAAAAQVKGSAMASPAPPKPAASAGGPMAFDSRNKAPVRNPVTSPFEGIALADAAYRRPLPQAEKAKSRRLKPLLRGTCLVLFAIFGVSAIYGSPLNWTFPTTKSQAIAGLSSAADVLKTDLEAITGLRAREERPAMRDLSAALTQLTVRLDQIEHEHGARLDEFSERVDQDSSSRFADIVARLDKLEKKAALPATPASESTDVVARLDKLEKRVAVAAAPASEITGFTTRLNKLEKKAADAGASSDVPSAVACRHFSIWRFPWPQPCAAKPIGGIY